MKHSPCKFEAWSSKCFFRRSMKVLMFIEPQWGLFWSDHLWMFCRRAVLFSCFCWDLFNIFCVWNFFVFTLRETCSTFFCPATCELVSRVEFQSSLSRVFDCPLNWVFNSAQPHILLLILGAPGAWACSRGCKVGEVAPQKLLPQTVIAHWFAEGTAALWIAQH